MSSKLIKSALIRYSHKKIASFIRYRLGFGKSISKLFATFCIAFPPAIFVFFLLAIPCYLYQLVSGIFIKKKMSANAFSDHEKNYLIKSKDFDRNTQVEANYRKFMAAEVIAAYDSKCCKCGSRNNGLELDHLFIPKSNGGNFAMKHSAGYWVNNCAPLCRTCNSTKNNRSWKLFFSRKEILYILDVNNVLTKRLNQLM